MQNKHCVLVLVINTLVSISWVQITASKYTWIQYTIPAACHHKALILVLMGMYSYLYLAIADVLWSTSEYLWECTRTCTWPSPMYSEVLPSTYGNVLVLVLSHRRYTPKYFRVLMGMYSYLYLATADALWSTSEYLWECTRTCTWPPPMYSEVPPSTYGNVLVLVLGHHRCTLKYFCPLTRISLKYCDSSIGQTNEHSAFDVTERQKTSATMKTYV